MTAALHPARTPQHRRLHLAGCTALAVTTLGATLLAGASDAAAATVTAPTALLRITVTGPDGEAAPGVGVGGSGFRGTTDSHGVFVAAVVPTAVKQVCAALTADSPLGGPAGWAQTCTPVTVTRGTTTDVRLVMKQGAAIRGTVIDARTGQPIVNAVLDHPTPDDGGVVPGARTDRHGVYTFRNLTPGPAAQQQVNVADDFVDAYPASAPWGHVNGLLTPTVALRAGEVATAGFDIALVPFVRLAGTVTDSSGAAAANADIVVHEPSGAVPFTTTNSQGHYLTIARWDQVGSLCASARPGTGRPKGLAESCRSGVFGQGVDVVDDFVLKQGTPPAVTPLVGEVALLSVTVVSPDGTPVPGIQAGNSDFHLQRTDAQGRLVFAVGTDLRTVCAYPDPASSAGGPTGYGQACVDVTPVRAETVTARIVVGAGTGFSGRITDARTGAAVPGATAFVSLAGEDGFPTATTDATGAYRFRSYPGIAVDRDTLGANGPASSAAAPFGYVTRYPAGVGQFPLQRGVLTKGVDLSLVPYVRVSGTVTDDTGKRVPNAYVTVQTGPQTAAATTTDAHGDYLFVVPWNSTGPVCAKVDPGGAYPHGLTKQCQNGLFRKGIEVPASFSLKPTS